MCWWIKLSKTFRIQHPTVMLKISRIRGPEIAVIRVVSQGGQENKFSYQFPDDFWSSSLSFKFFLTKVMLFLITPD
jgi:hypothetical protein